MQGRKDSDSDLDFFHTIKWHSQERSDDANLQVAVAGGVEDASVVAPVARAAAKQCFAIQFNPPRGRTAAEHHYVMSRTRERKLELNAEENIQP